MSRNISVSVNLEEIGLFRKAICSDIIEGNIVFLIGDSEEMHKITIEDVYNKNDEFKAFCASDGCRYGLYNLYVLKAETELEQEISKLKNVIENIKSSLNYL